MPEDQNMNLKLGHVFADVFNLLHKLRQLKSDHVIQFHNICREAKSPSIRLP